MQDEEKNRANIKKHGLSFRNAARVFFDYDRIEFYDEETEEDRFDTIGDTSAGNALLTRQGVSSTMIGDISRFTDEERKELERARSMPYVYDEDCPEVTPERAVKFRRVNPPRQISNRA